MNGLRQALRSLSAASAAACWAALVAVTLLGLGQTAGASEPTEAVEEINAALIDVMKNADSLGYEGRYERLAPVLERHFNFPLMARVAVGRHWSELSEEQREKLVERFARVSVATFAARFDGYSGESFRVKGQQPGLRGSILVNNDLIKSDGDAIPINYLLRQADERWRVVDVYLDAKYSELAMKRSEYSSVIRRKGFDGLMASIEHEISKLASEPGDA
jgi:phospholipid transport system substrate-binding protein